MAPHFSTLAWKVPWTEEPGRLQSMGSLGVGHDWVTSLSLFTFMHWRRKWQPTPVFLPGESRDGGSWWAAIYGVVQSQTRLKRLSCSSRGFLHIFQVICIWGLHVPALCSDFYSFARMVFTLLQGGHSQTRLSRPKLSCSSGTTSHLLWPCWITVSEYLQV